MALSSLGEEVTFRDVLGAVHAEREEGRAEERGVVLDAAKYTMMEWAEQVPERGRTLNFDLFPFQRDWYSEEVAQAREVVFMKSTQTGVSTYSWRWGARRADQFADTVIYAFPTDTHISQFGQERIEPSIEDSAYLSSRIPPGFVRNQHQKRIGAGWMYFRGSAQRRIDKRAAGAQSVAAQAIVFDEYDELDDRVRSQMERRISGAKQEGKEPRVRRIGVPSLEGMGIAAAWDKTDQRTWHVTCPACGLEQPVVWEDNVRWRNIGSDEILRADHDDNRSDVEEAWRVCKECEESLEGDPIKDGRWIATNPGMRVIGFHATRLIVPRTDVEEIVKASRKTEMFEVEAFYNNDLGVPFTSAETGLSREEVLALMQMGHDMAPMYDGDFLVTAGLDVASARTMHLRVSLHYEGKRIPLAVQEVESFQKVDPFMDRYNIRLLVVDHMPERQSARAFAARFPGRVMLARYEENPEKPPIALDTKNNLVTVQRTEAIDAAIAAIRDRRHGLPKHAPQFYLEHLISLKRKNVETPKGVRRFYIKTGGFGDDFMHAEVFDVVASDVCAVAQLVAYNRATANQHVGEAELGYETPKLDEDYGGGDVRDQWGNDW